ncbi:MAG: hypothetical protein ACRDUX_19235, partial [Mycobacterium sp.]
RRLDTLEREAASLGRRLAQLEHHPADDYRARLRAEADQVDQQIAYWTAKRDEVIQHSGVRVWSREDFVVGDRIRTAKGHMGTVRRVSKKTLTVNYDVMPPSLTNPVRYYDVLDIMAKTAAATTA